MERTRSSYGDAGHRRHLAVPKSQVRCSLLIRTSDDICENRDRWQFVVEQKTACAATQRFWRRSSGACKPTSTDRNHDLQSHVKRRKRGTETQGSPYQDRCPASSDLLRKRFCREERSFGSGMTAGCISLEPARVRCAKTSQLLVEDPPEPTDDNGADQRRCWRPAKRLCKADAETALHFWLLKVIH